MGRTLSVSLRSTAPPRGGALGKTGRSRPRRSTAGRSQPISGKLFAPAKASPFRERWHGEAVTERVASRTNPLRHSALRSATEGRALGRTSKFRPHSSTAGRSQPLSCKLSAIAKASPFRERWHGEAVTERVASGTNPTVSLRSTASSPFCRLAGEGASGTNPFRHFALRNATSPEGGGLGKEDKSRPH